MFTSLRHNKNFYTLEVRTDVLGDTFPQWRPIINMRSEGDAILYRERILKNCDVNRIKMMVNTYNPSAAYIIQHGLTVKRWDYES